MQKGKFAEGNILTASPMLAARQVNRWHLFRVCTSTWSEYTDVPGIWSPVVPGGEVGHKLEST